ncbi:MAG: hypothetical protein HQ471_02525 [Flavobacteriales bacterium]|jgi:hypothetical protein|nr:hypothetical protein [Flavobacteriales bacterium]
MLKKTLLVAFTILFCVATQAQDKQKSVKPFRIGFKVGVPNIVGGNAELVLFKRIAVYADYSAYSGTFDQVEAGFNHFEIGGNIYFNPTGKGFYASLGYSNFSLDGTYTDAQTIGGIDFTGTATGNVTLNTINAKLGLKLGRTFYMRTEVGYGFGTIPDKVIITGDVNGVTQTGEEAIPNIPGISSSGLLIFNIGFGFGFL